MLRKSPTGRKSECRGSASTPRARLTLRNRDATVGSGHRPLKPRKADGDRKRGPATSVSRPSWRKRAAVGGFAAVVLAAVLAVLLRSGSADADLRRIDGQNVLLITIDTLRADALGVRTAGRRRRRRSTGSRPRASASTSRTRTPS